MTDAVYSDDDDDDDDDDGNNNDDDYDDDGDTRIDGNTIKVHRNSR